MSSILKALKKIEEESPHPQLFPSLPQKTDAKKAFNASELKRLFARRWIAVLVILLVAIIAAVTVFSQRQLIIAKIFPPGSSDKKTETTGSSPEKSGVFKAKITSPTAEPATVQKKQTRQVKRQIKPIASNRKVNRNQADTRSNTPKTRIARKNPVTKPAPANRKPQPKAQARPQRSLKKKPPIQRAAISKKTIAGKNTASKTSAPGNQKSATTRTFARLDDSKLKLQALAWFKDAAKRMVVINGRIVREGESVDGYNVTQISREYVVVNDGRKSWSLEFGLKP